MNNQDTFTLNVVFSYSDKTVTKQANQVYLVLEAFFMKTLCILITNFFLLGFQPAPKPDGLTNFISYVSAHYKLPESVKEDCHWNYAIVKVMADKNNRITNYEVLNHASEDMKNSFHYLVGYRFTQGMHLQQRPVIFCFTVDNQKEGCAVDQNAYHSPSEVTGRILAAFNQQRNREPSTIFIYTVPSTIVYDTMK